MSTAFTNGRIFEDQAIEVPATGTVRLHDTIALFLGNNGGVYHVINSTGDQTECNASNTPTLTTCP